MPLFLLAPLPEVFCLPLLAQGLITDASFLWPSVSGLHGPDPVSWHPLPLQGVQRGTWAPGLSPPQDLAQCPRPSRCSTNVSWLSWIGLEWLTDCPYQNLTVLHNMLLQFYTLFTPEVGILCYELCFPPYLIMQAETFVLLLQARWGL